MVPDLIIFNMEDAEAGIGNRDVCGLCGESKEQIFNIFQTSYGDYNPVSAIFEGSMSVQISPDDGHPDMVCLTCLEEAVLALDFKSTWDNSHSSLGKYFKTFPKTEICELPEEGEEIHEDESQSNETYLNNPPFPQNVSGLYECRKCHKPFFSFRNLQHHTLTHVHSTQCRICKLECYEVRTLKKHYAEHRNNNITLCTWCGGIVKNGYHNFNFNYGCPFCELMYPCNLFLKNHIMADHPEQESQSCVAIIKKNETDMFEFEDDAMNTRIAKQGTEDYIEYKCSDCDRKFNSIHKLEDHITFLKCLNYCDYCGNKYKLKAQLRLHIHDKHLNIRPHLCAVCGKSFVRKGMLKSHQQVHTKKKPFQCHLCGKQFVNRWTLRYHSRLHTGEKPYICSICGEGFVKSSRLREHEQKWHIGKLQCPKCMTTFSQRCALKIHMDRFHPNTYERKQSYLMNPETEQVQPA